MDIWPLRDAQNEQSGGSRRMISTREDAGYASIAVLSIITIAVLLTATAIAVSTTLLHIQASARDSMQAYWLACGSAVAAERRLDAKQAVYTKTLYAGIGRVNQSVTDNDFGVITVEEVAQTAHAVYAVRFEYDTTAGQIRSWQEGLSV